MKTVLTAADWALLQEIFNQAVELAPEPRGVYLDEVCAGRADLRLRVEALVRSALNEQSLITSAVSDAAEDHAAGALPGPGDRIGAYEITRTIGRGGMGIVYEAVRADDQYEKKVAIKLVAAGLLTRDLLPRFRAERQILAQLDHPHVARLLDGGTTAAGLPYVVLEYVDGQPLDVYCRSQKLTHREIVRLMAQVARAVQYAHQNLVIHRDLKPGNILVTAGGAPKLLDFGIAKLLDLDGGPQTMETSRMMTPEYASPEQIGGMPVSTATDVYQLGIVTYELIHQVRPVRTPDWPPGVVNRGVIQDPPPIVKVDADLERVMVKAMESDPGRRYATAGAFADDLERYLDGFPVVARPASWSYRAGKFARRHRGGVAAAVAVLLLIAGFSVAMAVLAKRAQTEAATARQVTDFMVGLFEASKPDRGSADKVTARDLLDRGVGRIDRELRGTPEVQARLYDTIGSIYSNLGLFQQARDILAKSYALRMRLGLKNEEAAHTLGSLGELSFELGRFDDCARYFRQAAQLHLAAGGPRNKALVDDYSALAAALMALDRLGEAEDYGRRAVDLSTQVNGRATEPTALALNNLKSVVLLRGDYMQAERLAREAFEIRRALSPEGRDLAMYEGNLAYALGMLGRYLEAERYAREAYRLVLASIGDGSPAMAYRRVVLAKILVATGKLQEALPMARQGYEMQVKLLGAGHHDTSFGTETYSAALLAAGDAGHALALARTALNNRLRQAGPDHPETAVSWVNYGDIQWARGDLDEAGHAFRSAMRIRAARYGHDNPLVAEAAISLAAVANERRQFGEARALLRDALATLARRYPPEHPEIARARQELAIAALGNGTPAEAVSLLEQAFPSIRAAFGPAHPRTARIAIRLAEALQASGHAQRAQALVAEYGAIVDAAGPAARAERPVLQRLRATQPR